MEHPDVGAVLAEVKSPKSELFPNVENVANSMVFTVTAGFIVPPANIALVEEPQVPTVALSLDKSPKSFASPAEDIVTYSSST